MQNSHTSLATATIARVVVNDPSASLGELLRDHRRAAGSTQEELAEQAGVSPRSISELACGGADVPRRDPVGMLVRAFLSAIRPASLPPRWAVAAREGHICSSVPGAVAMRVLGSTCPSAAPSCRSAMT
jgi:hypothetical protein